MGTTLIDYLKSLIDKHYFDGTVNLISLVLTVFTFIAAFVSALVSNSTKKKMIKALTIKDLAGVRMELDTLREFHRDKEFLRALDRYSPIRQKLNNVRTGIKIDVDLEKELQTGISQLSVMQKAVEEAYIIDRTEIRVEVSRFNTAIGKIQDSIDKLTSSLTKS